MIPNDERITVCRELLNSSSDKICKFVCRTGVHFSEINRLEYFFFSNVDQLGAFEISKWTHLVICISRMPIDESDDVEMFVRSSFCHFEDVTDRKRLEVIVAHDIHEDCPIGFFVVV